MQPRLSSLRTSTCLLTNFNFNPLCTPVLQVRSSPKQHTLHLSGLSILARLKMVDKGEAASSGGRGRRRSRGRGRGTHAEGDSGSGRGGPGEQVGRGGGGGRGGFTRGRGGRRGGRAKKDKGDKCEPRGASGAASDSPPPSYSIVDPLVAAMEECLASSTSPSTASAARRASRPVSLVRTEALASLAEDRTVTEEELASDMATVRAAARRYKRSAKEVARSVAAAQRVSVCFLSDTTGSMESYIAGVRDQCKDIVGTLEASGCQISGLAFVGYKDWSEGEDHFEVLPFTEDMDAFVKFVDRVRANGGGDTAEDVLGGMSKAIHGLTWPSDSGCRVVFHFADAPQHGKRYHGGKTDDNFPEGHPKDADPVDLFDALQRGGIDYYFARLNNTCDKMLEVFKEARGGCEVETLEVGSDASRIGTAVIASVTKSVTVRSASCSGSSGGVGGSSGLDGGAPPLPRLEPSVPDFDSLPEYTGTQITFPLPTSVRSIAAFTPTAVLTDAVRVQIGPRPFAAGAIRLAYHGRLTVLRSGRKLDIVLKQHRRPALNRDLERNRIMVDVSMHSICEFLAREFNRRVELTSAYGDTPKLEFLRSFLIALNTGVEEEGMKYYSSEVHYRGGQQMLKLTNNLSFVRPVGSYSDAARGTTVSEADVQKMVECATAFSHFSHMHTAGYLLVCDLQGILTSARADGGGQRLIMTDPAIHCHEHLRFGKTNLRRGGIDAFYASHKCGRICRALGIKDKRPLSGASGHAHRSAE